MRKDSYLSHPNLRLGAFVGNTPKSGCCLPPRVLMVE
jgi:hypothetical protein